MGLTFFGLTSTDKVAIHKLLFSMAYHSNGAFDVDYLYNMPVYLRTFYMKQLEETKAEEAKAIKEAQRSSRPSKR